MSKQVCLDQETKTITTSSKKSINHRPAQISTKQTGRAVKCFSLQNQLDTGRSAYGQYQSSQYKVMRGYIPTKGVQIRLYYTKFQPKKKVAAVCVVHGYGQDTQNYLEMADHLAKNSIVVHIVDMRGFGYSGGDRIQTECTPFLDDIEVLLRCSEPNLPLFIVSHGFGSLLTFALLIQNPGLPINGCIAISPNLRETQDDSLLARFFRKWCLLFFQTTLVNNHLNPSGLSKNPKQLKRRLQDSLNYQYTTLNMLDEMVHLSRYVVDNAYKFEYPLAILMGAKNSLQDPEVVKELYDSISSKDKTFECFREGYHTMHLDDESSKLEEQIVAWIRARLVKTDKQRGSIPPLNKQKYKNMSLSRKIVYIILFLIASLKLFRTLKCKFF